MSWLAFLGVLLAVSLINQKTWLPIQRSQCLLNDAALCNLLFAYFVTSLIWLGVTIFLLALEALVTWLIHHWHDEDHTNAAIQPAMHHPVVRFFMWIERTTIWPTAPRLSRNLVFWLAAVGLASYSIVVAYEQLQLYVLITSAWTVTLVIAYVLGEHARRTRLTYSIAIKFKQAIAILGLLYGLLLSLIKSRWARLGPSREITEPRISTVQPSDEATFRLLWSMVLYCTATIFTLILLQEVPTNPWYIKLIQIGLFGVLLKAQLQGSWRPMLAGLYGLFTMDQYLLRIVPGSSMQRLPLSAHELAMFLIFVLLAWNSQQWEQTIRYHIALQAEQLRYKKSQQMHWH